MEPGLSSCGARPPAAAQTTLVIMITRSVEVRSTRAFVGVLGGVLGGVFLQKLTQDYRCRNAIQFGFDLFATQARFAQQNSRFFGGVAFVLVGECDAFG